MLICSPQSQLSINKEKLCTFQQISSITLYKMRMNNSVTNCSSLLAMKSQAIRGKKIQSLIQTFSILQIDEPATSETMSVRSLTARKRPESSRQRVCVRLHLFAVSVPSDDHMKHFLQDKLVQTLKTDYTPPLAAF